MKKMFKKLLALTLTICISTASLPGLSAAAATVYKWTNVGAAGFSADRADYTSLAIDSSGTPYVAYQDFSGNNGGKITVERYNNDTKQWETVGNADFSTGQANYISIKIDGNNTPYVAYADAGSNNKATVMKYVSDGSGNNAWVPVGTAGFSAGAVGFTSIAIASDGTPYVAYKDQSNNGGATVMKYVSGKNAWEQVGTAGFSAGAAYNTSLAIYNGTPYVAYQDSVNGGKATVMKYVSDGNGNNAWATVGTAGFSAGETDYISLAVYSGTPYVAYADGGNSGKATVMKYVSDGNGSNAWVPVGTAGFSADAAGYTSLAISSDGTPYVAYQDSGNGSKATVMKFDGTSWAPVGSAGFSAGAAGYTSLAIVSGTPYVAYSDGSGSGKATVMKCDEFSAYTVTYIAGAHGTINGAGSETVTSGNRPVSVPAAVPFNGYTFLGWSRDGGTTLLTNQQLGAAPVTGDVTYTAYFYSDSTAAYKWINVGSAGFSEGDFHTSLAIASDGTPYVAYCDEGSGFKATVMKYNGSNWVTVGTAGFSAGPAYGISLAIASDGTPYVAYIDNGSGGKATVMKYDGSNWVTVGTSGFSAGKVVCISLAIYNGTSYVAYSDAGNNNKATVMKYDGLNWVTVGSAGFSAGASCFISLAIYNGTPYVAYVDAGNNNKATVMKYDGSNWVPVGTAGFSGEAQYTSLAIYNGTPYVAYTDFSKRDKATVMKYDGSNWVTVGNAGFSVGSTCYNSLAIYNGTPFVAYEDFENTGKSIVVKYDGSNWVTVGNTGFSAGVVGDISLAIDSSGTPYVAYGDGDGGKATVMKACKVPGHTVTYGAGTHGWINGSISENVAIGSCPSNVPNVTPDDDYTFAGWSSDGATTLITSQQLGATPITGDVTYTAYYLHLTPMWRNVGNADCSGGQAFYTSLAIYNGTPYVAYQDWNNNGKATVMKYDGSKWVTVGNAGFSAGQANYTSLAIDGSGTPYVAYSDVGNGGKVTVMKYNGSSWVTVGSAGFSAGVADNTSLAIYNGTPYVAYRDAGNRYKATVMKYDGSNWVTVGNAGFSAGTADYASLAIYNGTPYVAYKDSGNGGKATVMKYDGSKWVTVGDAVFSAGAADSISLAIDGSGTPFVAYRDGGNGGKATVMMYSSEGDAWIQAGNQGFSAGAANCITLAIYNNTLYVAYVDESSSNKATVMKHDINAADWVTVGTAGFSAGDINYPSLAIDGGGTPYVAYINDDNNREATVMKYDKSPICTVVYNAGAYGTISGSNPNISTETLEPGHCPANVPAVSPHYGYTFTGWSKDGGITLLSNQQLSSTPITGDVTYVAYYSIIPGSFSGGSSSGGTLPTNPKTDTTVVGTTDPATGTVTAGGFTQGSTDPSTTGTITAQLGGTTLTIGAGAVHGLITAGGSGVLSSRPADGAGILAGSPGLGGVLGAAGAISLGGVTNTLTIHGADGSNTNVGAISGGYTATLQLSPSQLGAIGGRLTAVSGGISPASRGLYAKQDGQAGITTNPRLYYYDPAAGTLEDEKAVFDLDKGTVTFTTTHFGTFVIAIDKPVVPVTNIGVAYSTHVQKIGWQNNVADGVTAGTTGRALRLEGLKISLTGDVPSGAAITYQAHVQKIGWQKPVSNGAAAGTTGKSLRVEALKITLNGLDGYQVRYRVYVQGKGWMAWQVSKNGTTIDAAGIAGTTGKGLRVEAVQVVVEKA